MAGNRAYKSGLLAIIIAIFLALSLFIGRKIYAEQKLLDGFRQAYGDDWKEHYEQRYGPGSLDRAYWMKIIGFASMPVTATLLGLIYLQLRGGERGGNSPGRRKKDKQKYQW